MSADTLSIDHEKLAHYLQDNIAGFQGPLTTEKFSGGQSNPTFLIKAQSGQYVLRRKPPGKLLPSAHAIDREYRVINALAGSNVPVPTAYHFCEDDSIVGSMFYVMSFEQGRIFWDPALPELPKEQRGAMHDELIRVMAAIHEIDVESCGLSDYGKAGNYFERQLSRWVSQYRTAETKPLPAVESLIEWLQANIPADDGQVSLIHGDFRLDNLIFDPTDAKGIAMLDWELSTLGHPTSDLAYFCMCLRLPSAGNVSGLAGKDRDELGVPSEKTIIELYCQLRGIDNVDNWIFCVAFSFFRLSAILQGVLKRALNGNASNDQALKVGKMAEPLAQMALVMIKDEG